MPVPFYTNNGKSLNREDILHVLNASEIIYYDNKDMLTRIDGVKGWIGDDIAEMKSEAFANLLRSYGLQICIDETDPEHYLFLLPTISP